MPKNIYKRKFNISFSVIPSLLYCTTSSHCVHSTKQNPEEEEESTVRSVNGLINL